MCQEIHPWRLISIVLKNQPFPGNDERMANLEMQESSSFPSSSSSCQQRLMQKVRRLSAAALWSISFNPLHLSSLPPPPSSPPSLFNQLPSLSSSTLLFVFPYSPPAHVLVGCKPRFMELLHLFPVSSSRRTSPTNPSPRKSANQPGREDPQPCKIPRNLRSAKYQGRHWLTIDQI